MSRPVCIAFIGLLACSLGGVPSMSADAVSQAASPAPQSRTTIVGTVVNASLTPLVGAIVTLEQGTRVVAKATTDAKGAFRFTGISAGEYTVQTAHSGFPTTTRTLRVSAGSTSLTLPIVLSKPGEALQESSKVQDGVNRQSAQQGQLNAPPPPAGTPPPPPMTAGGVVAGVAGGAGGGRGGSSTVGGLPAREQIYQDDYRRPYPYPETGETYARIDPNRFHSTRERPLSTFGADVDTASYTNVRRFLSSGQLPPKDAVRVEELINYFQFGYAAPRDGRPIALTTEVGDCPWAPTHKLVLIGARAGSSSAVREISGRNIVLLIDVSGSMAPPERLPLIKTALSMFVDTLRPDDTLSIVTYAGSSGVALRPTPASRRDIIQRSISYLNASGSTNGAQGLITAYRIAREAYVPGGVNRVILATDGDFNVGVTSQHDLLDLIERERESGVFLSVFGVGSGNLKDATMEMLADRGNGHYAYVDSLQEARRVLIREGDATLETVAKDVKFQVEFNPAVVSAWKLIGYENRALAARDFNNDRKDAGEVGSGQTVTVLYEVIPAGVDRGDDVESSRPEVDALKYQNESRPSRPAPAPTPATQFAGEWLTVKARYKLPDAETSNLISVAVRNGSRVQHLPLASAIAEYGLLLRDAPRNETRWDALARRVDRLTVPASQANDLEGFKELVAIGKGLARIR
jgi:Ca-activated chloride channel family protein